MTKVLLRRLPTGFVSETGRHCALQPVDQIRRNGSARNQSASANDANGELWRATAPYEPRHLMPVDIVGVHLGQSAGKPQPHVLSDPPVVHERVVRVD